MRTSTLGAHPKARAIAPAVVWLAGLGIAASPQAARSDPPPAPDHLTLLENLTTAAARDVVTELALPPGTTVHLVPETEHPANWLVQRSLAHWLTETGCHVVFRPSDGPSAPPAQAQPSAPAPQPRLLPGAPGPQQAGSGGSEVTGDGSGAPGEPDSSAARSGEEGAEEGDEQTPAGEEGASGEQGDEGTGETLSIVQQRRQERMQREAEQQALQQAQAAATQPAPATGSPEVDLEHALPVEGEVLLYRVAELEVSYPWIKRSWIVGPRRYGRLATVRLRASHLTEPGHRVRDVAQGDRVAIDEFPGWARSYLEGPQYPFTISQPEQKSLQRFVEPVFVAAIVSGLVYLFYENQK